MAAVLSLLIAMQVRLERPLFRLLTQYREQVTALRGRLHKYFEDAGAPPIEDWRSTTIQKLPMDQEGYYAWLE